MLVHNQDLSRCASTRSFSYPQAEAEVFRFDKIIYFCLEIVHGKNC